MFTFVTNICIYGILYIVIQIGVCMRNILIVLFIGLVLISVFGFYANLNDGHNLLKKLDKFEQIDKLYYQSQFSFKLADTQDVKIIVKQYKRDNNYNAQAIFPQSDIVINLEKKGGILSFEQDEVLIRGSIGESKEDKSIFWLDKLTADDILPDSIKKIKTPADFEAGECDMYSAKLKATMTNVDICINKDNVPVYFKYYDYKNFTPLPFNINSKANLKKYNGNIIIRISDIKFNSDYDSSFDMHDESKLKEIIEVKEIKSILEPKKPQSDEIKNSTQELNNDDKNVDNDNEEK